MIRGYDESCEIQIKGNKTPSFSCCNQRKEQKVLGEVKNADAKVVVLWREWQKLSITTAPLSSGQAKSFIPWHKHMNQIAGFYVDHF